MAVQDGHITWWLQWQGEREENLQLLNELITTQLQYFLVRCVCVCATSPWVFHQMASSRALFFYSSVASFLLVSCPSKIGYLLSTSAQLSEPLAKSRTITGNSLTWQSEINKSWGLKAYNRWFCWRWLSAYLGSDLPHGVTVSQGGRMRRLVHSVEVDGDAKRHPNLIRPGIAPANGARWVVHFVGDAIFRHGFS